MPNPVRIKGSIRNLEQKFWPVAHRHRIPPTTTTLPPSLRVTSKALLKISEHETLSFVARTRKRKERTRSLERLKENLISFSATSVSSTALEPSHRRTAIPQSPAKGERRRRSFEKPQHRSDSISNTAAKPKDQQAGVPKLTSESEILPRLTITHTPIEDPSIPKLSQPNKSPYLPRVFHGPRIRTKPFDATHKYRNWSEPLWEGYFVSYLPSAAAVPGTIARPPNPIQVFWNSNRTGEFQIGHLYSKPDLKMKASVQVITTPTADTPGTTLLLNFERKRYLIGNIAEGTQRAAIQRKAKLAAVKDIFLTGEVKWANMGGIMGMILTVADIISGAKDAVLQQLTEKFRKRGQQVPPELLQDEGDSWLNLHGGRNLTHLLATARRFIFRKGVPLHTNEFTIKTDLLRKDGDWEPTWKDDFVQVWSMVIEPEVKDEAGAARQRKRSHEEFMENAQMDTTGKKETKEERDDRYEQMRKSVISDMFDSSWRLDALVKKQLGEVRLPAEIFHRDEEGKIGKYTGPMPAEDPSVSDVEVLVRNPWPGAMVESLPPTTPSKTSVCYFFKSHPQRGKFDPKLAEKLGVPNGPSRAKLVRGEAFTTEDGKVVTPDMVLGATKTGGGFAVIELPSEAYIGSLLARKEWHAEEVMSGVGAVFWILGPNVLHDERLQTFMAEKKELRHIVSSNDCCPDYLAMESAATLATRLNMIDAERFHIPKFNNELFVNPSKDLPFQAAMIGLNLEILPEIKLRKDLASKFLSIENVKTETEKIYPDALAIASKVRNQIEDPEYMVELERNQEDILHKDAEIITLGTGSALPSKYRNVSATLLRVPGVGNYLFDAGENTIGQLKRVFGDELPEVLKDLKVIWISHLHADHHLGTASVIQAWHEQTKDDEVLKVERLVVASDIAMLNWLQEYSQVENYGYSRIDPISMTESNNKIHTHNFTSSHPSGLASITSCSVRHCNGALAVVFSLPDGFKVAYSGDCRPSREFARIGYGATLLIHEATFDDELQGDAYAKKHCTTSEALDIGRQMHARRILLTHFSQRYQKVKDTDPQGGKGQVAVVAFDYMRIRIGDMVKVEGFKQAMAKLFDGREKGGDE